MCALFLKLTSIKQFPHAQVADGEPHDGGLVQVGGHIMGQGQLVGQLIEHLRLFAPAAASGIAGLLLPALRAHPVCVFVLGRLRERGGEGMGEETDTCF